MYNVYPQVPETKEEDDRYDRQRVRHSSRGDLIYYLNKNCLDRYDTTAAGILMRKQQQNSTIKTLVAMSRFKGNLLKEKQENPSDKRTPNAPPGEKVGMKQNTKEVTKTEEKISRYTNFSNLVDRRRRIRKEKAPIVTMKTIRAIEILPRKGTAEEKTNLLTS